MTNGLEYDFFGHNHPPRKVDTPTSRESNFPLSQKELEARQNFFGGDLLTILGQGPIKKIPKYNNTDKVEEPLSAETEAEIKEIFGENYIQSMFPA